MGHLIPVVVMVGFYLVLSFGMVGMIAYKEAKRKQALFPTQKNSGNIGNMIADSLRDLGGPEGDASSPLCGGEFVELSNILEPDYECDECDEDDEPTEEKPFDFDRWMRQAKNRVA